VRGELNTSMDVFEMLHVLGMKDVPKILLALDGRELNFSGIKKKVSISNAWLHKVLNKLEAEGLIVGTPALATNGRAVKLYRLTEKGKSTTKLLHMLIENEK